MCKPKLVRHLHDDMGLDLEAVDLVLRYRNQIQEMQRRLDEMEQRLPQKGAGVPYALSIADFKKLDCCGFVYLGL